MIFWGLPNLASKVFCAKPGKAGVSDHWEGVGSTMAWVVVVVKGGGSCSGAFCGLTTPGAWAPIQPPARTLQHIFLPRRLAPWWLGWAFHCSSMLSLDSVYSVFSTAGQSSICVHSHRTAKLLSDHAMLDTGGWEVGGGWVWDKRRSTVLTLWTGHVLITMPPSSFGPCQCREVLVVTPVSAPDTG